MTHQKKVIVFCHTCNRIVGDGFPVDHWHGFGNGAMAVKMLCAGDLGLGCYEDTPENHKFLADHYPPRDEVTVRLD